MSEPSKAACIGAVLGIVAAAAIWAFVLLAGLTFGQRCMIEALPNESVQACVQRLIDATDNKEQ
ncbi:hypothetical protein IB257_24985 [Achromobacter sp. ACM03]|uniref:hypothetical protein n=1 Tax=Achromobacter sp. ACM03 TaxID=2769300 RepID=UPI00177A9AED|nr:hypothetical protein [Achromobacter sp. ACM03]MBD9433206.1 hypothetical protein [Achromobacter sp. ACM03]